MSIKLAFTHLPVIMNQFIHSYFNLLTWQSLIRQTVVSLLLSVLLFSRLFSVIIATSSDFSISDFDLDKILSFPTESEQRFTSPLISHENETPKEHTQQHTSDHQTEVMSNERKKSRYKRKREKVKQNPSQLPKKEKRKRTLPSLSEEELAKRKIERRTRDRKRYQLRKIEKGYGSKQTEELKEIRKKMNLCTATSEEISKYTRNLEQKRNSAWKKKERSQTKQRDHQ